MGCTSGKTNANKQGLNDKAKQNTQINQGQIQKTQVGVQNQVMNNNNTSNTKPILSGSEQKPIATTNENKQNIVNNNLNKTDVKQINPKIQSNNVSQIKINNYSTDDQNVNQQIQANFDLGINFNMQVQVQ